MTFRWALVAAALLALLVPPPGSSAQAGWRKEVSRAAKLPIAPRYAAGFRASLSSKWLCRWLPGAGRRIYACAGTSRGVTTYLLLTHPRVCRYRSYVVVLNVVVRRHPIKVHECG